MPLRFNKTDLESIKSAIEAGGKVWENELLKDVKTKIKDYYRNQLNEQCCYCRRNTTGEFRMVLDIEHIIPKTSFPDYTFKVSNLSVSCKRCNMNIKGEDYSFIPDSSNLNKLYNKSRAYKIIHPNLDKYFSHLKLMTIIFDDKKLIKYNVVDKSEKGKYTYDYFKLKELEINTLNDAQEIKSSLLSENIPPSIVQEINENLKLL